MKTMNQRNSFLARIFSEEWESRDGDLTLRDASRGVNLPAPVSGGSAVRQACNEISGPLGQGARK